MVVLPFCLCLQPHHHFWKTTTHQPPSHKPGPTPSMSAPLLHACPCLVEGEGPPRQQMQKMWWGYSQPTMMTMVVGTTTTMTWGATKMPNGVGDKFEAPHERDEAEFSPLRVTASPPSGSRLARGGGSPNTDNGARQSSWSQRGGKSKRAWKEGSTNKCKHTTSSGHRTWRISHCLCCRGGNGGRGWINTGCPQQERDDYKGTMTTTNNCNGRGRHNAEGRWNQNIRSAKRGDNYGASNIILPCPGS